MIIKKSGILDRNIIKNIRRIEEICKEYDNVIRDINLDSSRNFNKEMNHTFLYYDKNNVLIGFIYLFVPSKEEAELQGYILPKHRHKGYFRELLKVAEAELKKYNIRDILFVLEFNPNNVKYDLSKIKAEYEFTEYSMEYISKEDKDIEIENFDIELLEASKEDLQALIDVSRKAFDESHEEAKGYILRSLNDENRIQYKVLYNGEYIGIGGVYLDRLEATIYGFGIVPGHRGKGFGGQLLRLILMELKKKEIDEILIDVDSNNEIALKLYKKVGFDIEVAFDYYRKKI